MALLVQALRPPEQSLALLLVLMLALRALALPPVLRALALRPALRVPLSSMTL